MKNTFLNTLSPEWKQKAADAFLNVLQIMEDLRAKCPWDKKQTIHSLRHLTIEETYELSEAIIANDYSEIKKEIGDIFLHLVFYSKIASEMGAFDIIDVLEALSEKLIRRHPHIYANTKADDEETVKRNWEQIKLSEKENQSHQEKTILGGVPKSLPAMVKAYRIQEKARGAGFDWEKKEQVWQKVEEELAEFKKEFDSENAQSVNLQKAEAEFGDLLFSLINYARFLGINPEDALEKTNQKFIRRFNFLETQVRREGKSLQQMTLDEMDTYWNQAKRMEIQQNQES
ncbi:MAG: nucleoside triphosphate pyrophosphohydrolase [Cytophagales bacterium]|nr:nucleoside triphosphate pyrophosphohydrolase [Cytophagales bacterium]MDW8383134.1 nucleoside triphosphate pyrophosphohydrolase [Flammeovirgaceae bacterium]